MLVKAATKISTSALCCAFGHTEEVVLDFSFKNFHVLGRKLEFSQERVMMAVLLSLSTVPPHLFVHPLSSRAHTLMHRHTQYVSAERDSA